MVSLEYGQGDKTISTSISIIIPTKNRHHKLEAVLQSLSTQSLSKSMYEVIVVDDGSEIPVKIHDKYTYRIILIRTNASGPAAARNLAIEVAKAPLLLFANDDAIFSPSALSLHISTQELTTKPTAVLGRFDFTEKALLSPFTQVVDNSTLLFAYSEMQDGHKYDWRYFWTCNLSIPKDIVVHLDGFDSDLFDAALVEDVELGYRLYSTGVPVLFNSSIECLHDHAIEPKNYFHRMRRLGVYLYRMYLKHNNPKILWQDNDFCFDEPTLLKLQVRVEVGESLVLKEIHKIERLIKYDNMREADINKIRMSTRQAGVEMFHAGMLEEYLSDKFRSRPDYQQLNANKLTEIFVYSKANSKGSFSESVKFLGSFCGESQISVKDIKQNPMLLSASGLKEYLRGFSSVEASWIVILHEDAALTENWLSTLIAHASVDPFVGCTIPYFDTLDKMIERPLQRQLLVSDPKDSVSSLPFAYLSDVNSPCLLFRKEAIMGERPDGFAWRVRVALDTRLTSIPTGYSPPEGNVELLAESTWGDLKPPTNLRDWLWRL